LVINRGAAAYRITVFAGDDGVYWAQKPPAKAVNPRKNP
jgi:hypothetical protein